MTRKRPAHTSAKQDAKAVARLAKRDAVVRLRCQGATFEAIAKTLGMGNGSVAHKAFRHAMDTMERAPIEAARPFELVKTDAKELELNSIITSFKAAAMRGDAAAARIIMDAHRELRGWADHRARLLGLYAPQKHELAAMVDVSGVAMRVEVVEVGAADEPTSAEPAALASAAN